MYKTAAIGAGVAGGVVALALVVGLGFTGVAGADGGSNRATVRDAWGKQLGTVSFVDKHDVTEVRVRMQVDPAKVATDAFHGMHIHANGDTANGVGCEANPAAEPSTWFVSADGHWKADGQDHAGHHGDLASVYVTATGHVDSRYTTSRIDRSQLRGKVVIFHALADNFGNVPVGSAANQYTANSPDALTATKNTGNAGPRLGCGVIGAK